MSNDIRLLNSKILLWKKVIVVMQEKSFEMTFADYMISVYFLKV